MNSKEILEIVGRNTAKIDFAIPQPVHDQLMAEKKSGPFAWSYESEASHLFGELIDFPVDVYPVIERELRNLLKVNRYQWEFNNGTLSFTPKYKGDSECDNVTLRMELLFRALPLDKAKSIFGDMCPFV